jgi:hypothetical protein
MNNHRTSASIARTFRRPAVTFLGVALLLTTKMAAAGESKAGWSGNLTPVLIFGKGEYRFGGGADPELKYTLDFGSVRASAGGRVGTYYARNLFGVTVMPTLRLAVPVGVVEPYVSVGMGYGWLPAIRHSEIATMSRAGVVVHFTKKIAVGVEATTQGISGSDFRFLSFGSMLSLDF